MNPSPLKLVWPLYLEIQKKVRQKKVLQEIHRKVRVILQKKIVKVREK